MNDRIKSIAALGASGLAGVLVASLVLAIDVSADSRNAMGAGHDRTSAIPLCGGVSDASRSTFYSEMTKVNARMHQGMEIVPSGDIDRDFMRMMIPHHQGAIDMALLELKYGHDERLRRLAQSIIVEQGQEIAYMRTLPDTASGAASTARPATDE
jgi:uncharacterized protein (DUF305 family)